MKKVLSFIVALTLCFGLSSCTLQGCTFFNQLNFLQDSIYAGVGEVVSIDDYIQADAVGYYNLTSSNEKVAVVLNRNTVKLMGKGSCTITAKYANKSGIITIYADYKEPTDIKLFSTQSIFYNDYKPVTFTALLNEGANPNTQFTWFVNGTQQSTTDDSFTLGYPPTPASVEVSVQANKLTAQKTAYFLSEFNGTLIKEQNRLYLSNQTQDNIYAEWFVNSKSVLVQYQQTPQLLLDDLQAGNHLIEVKVNNYQSFFATHTTQGNPVLNDLHLDYYSAYPQMLLSWSNPLNESVQISLQKNGQTSQIEVDATLGSVDISNHVTVQNSFSILSGDNAIEFEALNQTAISYLQQAYAGGNMYMSSMQDIASLFEYMVIFRSQRSGSTLKKSFYMGFDPQINISQAENYLFDSLSITGSYGWRLEGSFKKDSVCSLYITYYTDNHPSDFSSNTPVIPALISPQFSTVGYLGSLAVDNYPLSSEKITTSDELFFALEKGLKPDLTANSSAQRMYNKAYQALTQIIDNDMDDVQITSAIYEYVVFLVTYDTNATYASTIKEAVKLSAYYIEGVLDTSLAVCDGISKTFSLMCNMAGIKTVRVTGLVLQAGAWGNHAWNKVKIDDNWYICDATWDSYDCSIGAKTYKVCTKNYFLLGERSFYLKRYETGGSYPTASPYEYDYFSKYNRYIHNYQPATQMDLLAQEIDKLYSKVFYIGSQKHTNPYFLIEISFSPSLKGAILAHVVTKFPNVQTILSNTTVMLIFA